MGTDFSQNCEGFKNLEKSLLDQSETLKQFKSFQQTHTGEIERLNEQIRVLKSQGDFSQKLDLISKTVTELESRVVSDQQANQSILQDLKIQFESCTKSQSDSTGIEEVSSKFQTAISKLRGKIDEFKKSDGLKASQESLDQISDSYTASVSQIAAQL